jgi:hypothetical protein
MSGTSRSSVPQAIYGQFYATRDVGGLVALRKADVYYEHETRFVFDGEAGRGGATSFTFLWDVVDGFDEGAVSFDKPGVSYEIIETEAVGEGWRRLIVRCEGMDTGSGLTAVLRYSAEELSVRDAAPGYYKWDLDAYTAESIPELDAEIASFENPYACANWIKENIAYENVTEAPQTVAETFYSGKGDCDDRAILFCYMVKRLFPEMGQHIVEGWTKSGDYHANIALHTDDGWLLLDPSMSSTKFGVFDFEPFVPSSRISLPYNITDADGREREEGSLGIAFNGGVVREG